MQDFGSFLAALKAAGVEVKQGKHLAFKIPGSKRFVRCSSLGEDYTEDIILERISGKRIITPKQKHTAPNLLIDIQAKLQQEYAALLMENKKLHPDQKKARLEMIELLTVKHNTSRILGMTEEERR